MEIYEFIQLIKRKKQTIFAIVLLFLLFGTFFTLLSPKKYTSKTKLLVVQQVSKDFDLYSVSKSNTYLSKILANVVESNTFYTQIFNSGFDIDKSFFTDDVDKQAKLWEKTVRAEADSEAGILNISVIHPSQYQSDQIIRAINQTLKSSHTQYHGAGDQVQIRTIDQPFTSRFPVKPNMFVNYFLSLVFGIMSALTFIYVLPEKKYDIIILPTFKKNAVHDNVHEFSGDETYDFAADKAPDARTGKEPQIDTARDYQEEYAQIEPEDLSYEEVVKRGNIENVIRI